MMQYSKSLKETSESYKKIVVKVSCKAEETVMSTPRRGRLCVQERHWDTIAWLK